MWGMSAISDEDRLDRTETVGVLRRTYSLARDQRRLIVIAFGLVVVSTLVSLAGPVLVRFGIDHGIKDRDGTTLNVVVGLYVAVVIVGYAVGRLQYVAINRAGEGFLRDLRLLVFRRLQRQSMAFFDREKAGVLVSRMTADIESMSELIQFGLLQFVSSFLLLLMSTVLLFAMSWNSHWSPSRCSLSSWSLPSDSSASPTRPTSRFANEWGTTCRLCRRASRGSA